CTWMAMMRPSLRPVTLTPVTTVAVDRAAAAPRPAATPPRGAAQRPGWASWAPWAVPLLATRRGRVRRCAEAQEAQEAQAQEEVAMEVKDVELEEEEAGCGGYLRRLMLEAPAKRKLRERRMPFDPKAEPGAMEPLGYFDPLGLCPPGDEGKFKQLRAAELKHGRVAMLASVGLLAQCYIRLPFLGLKDSPAGYQAALLVPSLWMFGLVVITAMLFEWLWWKEDPWKEPGNFGDPLGLNMYDRDMRNRELNNGRFAMFATSGILAAELYTGQNAAQQLGLQ
ncbi:unnamed protein product, partial [Cladocopium goreaui]